MNMKKAEFSTAFTQSAEQKKGISVIQVGSSQLLLHPLPSIATALIHIPISQG